MRKITRTFARLFGAESAIYVPDSGWGPAEAACDAVSDGWSATEILEWLRRRGGRAVPAGETIEHMRDMQVYGLEWFAVAAHEERT
jgi:hypothetical protein